MLGQLYFFKDVAVQSMLGQLVTKWHHQGFSLLKLLLLLALLMFPMKLVSLHL